MKRSDALTMLRRARDGRDPTNGGPLPPDHPFQQPDVVRALFVAVDALERVSGERQVGDAGSRGADDTGGAEGDGDPAERRPRKPRPPNTGRPWSDEDDRRLVEAFDGGAEERELAEAFGRSRSSVRARLIRLGRGALLGDGPAPRYPVRAREEAPATT